MIKDILYRIVFNRALFINVADCNLSNLSINRGIHEKGSGDVVSAVCVKRER